MDADPTARVLVVALPRRHLEGAAATCAERGSATIPAGGPGDLDATAPGTEVLLIVTGPDEVPAATWRAAFVRRLAPPPGELPDGLPPAWVDEHGSSVTAPAPDDDRDADDGDEDEDEDEDDGRVGPQAFFEVRGLDELPRQAWVFANELVRKQDRGGRAFVPRVPRLIRRPA